MPLSVSIRESYSGANPLRVDRAAGIIYGVKVLGKTSPNTHGKRNVVGTDYLLSAHKSLVSIIESKPGGMPVNKNHTEKNDPNRDRRIDERLGWLKNSRVENNETFADLHALDMSDPDTVKIFNAAEKNPYCYALSIDADGHYEVKNSRLAIDRFNKVRSVDAVTDGGTNISLAESNRTKGKPMTLKESLIALGMTDKQQLRLFEMGDSLLKPDMSPDAEPEAVAEETAETHLGKAVLAFINDEAMTPEIKKKKILAIMKILGDETEVPAAAEGETPIEEGDDAAPFAKKDGEDAGDDDEEKKKVKESLELKQLRTEKNVRRLCESLQFTPTELQVKAMSGLDDAERKQFVAALKGTPAGAKGTGLPRTSPRAGDTSVKESKTPANAAEQAKMLLRTHG